MAAFFSALPAGTSLAMVLQVAVVYMINYEYAVYIAIGTLVVFVGGLCYLFDNYAMHVANAITASYVVMRSIGLIMGYPYEFVIYYER